MANNLTPQEQQLREQIRQQWGGYGDWKAADQDQIGDLARVLAANGITDLSKLDFREGEYLLDQSGEGGMGKTVDVLYDGRQLGYLGDVNRDGSLGKLAVDRLRADEEFLASKRGDPNEQYWQDFHKFQNGGITNRGDSGAPLLAWSSRGGGNTSFQLVKDPKTGKFVVAPKWGSSSQGDKHAAITAAAILAGGTYAGLSSAGTTAGLSGLDAAMIDAGAGATTAGTTAGTAGGATAAGGSAGLSTVAVGADSLAPIAFEPITAQTLAGSGTAIQGGGTVGGSLGLGGATVGNGAWLGDGVASGVPSWDAAAIKSAVTSGELGTAANYGLQTLGGGTALETAGQVLNPATTAANQTTQQVARQGGSNSPSSLNGWDQLARIGGGAIAAGVAGNALADPVDTSRFDALFDNIIAEQQKASQRGDDLWATYQSTWKPLEQKFAESALNFDTPQRREQYAQRASDQVATNYDLQRQEARGEMIRAGVDPSTIQALGTAARGWQAKDEAAAQNDARMKVEMGGLDLLSGGANFARNISNAATDQSRVATGNTQAASGVLNQQAGLQNQNTANRNALIGDLFGAGLTAWGMYQSSKKTKKVGSKVDGLAAAKAIEKSPAKKWAYKPGQGDGSGKQRMGPMAEDLKREAPGVSDGKQVDAISQLGLHHAAIGNLNKRIRQLEKQADGTYAEA